MIWIALGLFAFALAFPIFVAVRLRGHHAADMDQLRRDLAAKAEEADAALDGKVRRTRDDCTALIAKAERALRDEMSFISGAVWYKVCRRDAGHLPAQDARVMEALKALKEMGSPPDPTDEWRAQFRDLLVSRGLRPSLVPRPGQKPACAVCGSPCDTIAVEPI